MPSICNTANCSRIPDQASNFLDKENGLACASVLQGEHGCRSTGWSGLCR